MFGLMNGDLSGFVFFLVLNGLIQITGQFPRLRKLAFSLINRHVAAGQFLNLTGYRV